jgi:hypothetical protein
MCERGGKRGERRGEGEMKEMDNERKKKKVTCKVVDHQQKYFSPKN